MRGHAVLRAGLALSLATAWCLSDVSVGLADTIALPDVPTALPSQSGTIDFAGGTIDATGVTLDEVTVGEGAAEACAATGVETAGVGCLAAGAIGVTVAAGVLIYHFGWGADHVVPEPPNEGAALAPSEDTATQSGCTADHGVGQALIYFANHAVPTYNGNTQTFTTDQNGATGCSASGDNPEADWAFSFPAAPDEDHGGTSVLAEDWYCYEPGNPDATPPIAPTLTYSGHTHFLASGSGLDSTITGNIQMLPGWCATGDTLISEIGYGDEAGWQGDSPVVENYFADFAVSVGQNPGYTPPSSERPKHRISSDMTCSGGDHVTASTAEFDDAASDVPELAVGSCPAGEYPKAVQLTDNPTGTGPGSTPLEVPNWTAPAEWGYPSSPYADCEPGGTDVPCPLIWQTTTPGGTQWSPCDESADACAGLQAEIDTEADPTNSPQLTGKTVTVAPDGTVQTTGADPTTYPTGTADFRCLWGSYHVDASECEKGDTPTSNNQPTDTKTPGPVDNASDSCFPTGWGLFNPIEWVEKPIKCALTWAFVPDETQLEAQAKTAHDSLGSSTIGQFGTAVGGFVTMFTGPLGGENSGSCLGPSITVSQLGLTDFHPLDACDEPMKTVALVTHTALELAVYIGLVLLGIRGLGGAMGVKTPFAGSKSEDTE